MQDYESDMKYLKNVSQDFFERNIIVESVNSFIEYEEFYRKIRCLDYRQK